jgi:hypothetical protein
MMQFLRESGYDWRKWRKWGEKERERERDFIPLVFHLLISFFNMSTEERRTYSLE